MTKRSDSTKCQINNSCISWQFLKIINHIFYQVCPFCDSYISGDTATRFLLLCVFSKQRTQLKIAQMCHTCFTFGFDTLTGFDGWVRILIQKRQTKATVFEGR